MAFSETLADRSLLAVQRVGPTGKVVGVDLCAAMVAKAPHNAELLGLNNAAFGNAGIDRLGPYACRSLLPIHRHAPPGTSAPCRQVRLPTTARRIAVADSRPNCFWTRRTQG